MPTTFSATARRVLSCALLAIAIVPATADAKIIELGQTAQQPTPSCPTSPCQAVSRTTGYQAKVGTQRGLFVVPQRGRIVAWTIALGEPTAKQVKFFNTTLGGPPSAGITVFKPSEHLYGTIVSQSPVVQLTPYLGETVQFPLERTLPVRKGQTVALTVPTWAPALAVGFPSDTSWRASRTRKQCDDTATPTSVSTLGTVTRFLCLYKTARLTYQVTIVTDPEPAKPKPKPTATPTPTAKPKSR